MNKSKQSGNSSFQADMIPPKIHHYEGFWARTCMILGAVQVIVGVLCIVMNGIGIHFHAHMHNYAQGMWGGAVFFVTGFICVFAGFYRTPIPVKLAMAASIISIVVAIPMMGITAAGLDHDRKINFSYWIKDDYYGNDYLDGKESFRKAAHAMILALSLLELVLASLTVAVTAHAAFYCNTYKGANQSTGNAMMFPKSSSPVPPEINVSSSQPGVPGYRYNNHDTSVASDPPLSPLDVNPDLSQEGSQQPDVSRESASRIPQSSSQLPTDSAQPGVEPALKSPGPSAFQQYPGANQPPPQAPVQSKSAVGTGRGPPQPQMVHTRADTSHSSLNTTTTSQKKGPKLQVPHSRHDMSTSSVETTGSKPRGPAMQQPHQRHDMSYSSVDSYPSVQSGGGMGYPPPARTSSRSSNQGPYPQYGGERNVHPARPLEGFSQPGYNQQGGQYPGYQQRRV